MRTRIALLIVVLFLLAADKAADEADARKLSGQWLATKVSADGKELPADAVKKVRVAFTGEKLAIKGIDPAGEGAYKLDAGKKVKEIDYTIAGLKKGEKLTIKGIYQLDGDNLKLCLGETRPIDFVGKKDSLSFVLKRATAAEIKEADQAEKKDAEKNVLRAIGIAYANYLDTVDAPPAKAEDLSLVLDNNPRFLNPLKSGDIVFIYKAHRKDMKDGPAKTVLAYEKPVPTKGGNVLMGDGKVVEMTAEQFKKAIVAKPKDK